MKNDKQTVELLYNKLKDQKVVFDLDGVVLNAKHRQCVYTEDDGVPAAQVGQLNLAAYIKNCTPELIAQDEPLPLMELIHRFNADGVKYHVATARVLCEANLELLAKHNVTPEVTISRALGDKRPDHLIKAEALERLFDPSALHEMVLIDDNIANCAAVSELGMKAIHIPFEGH